MPKIKRSTPQTTRSKHRRPRTPLVAEPHGRALRRGAEWSLIMAAAVGIGVTVYPVLKKRASLLERAPPSMVALAALVAAGCSAILLFVPKHGAALEDGPRRIDNGYSWSNATSAVAGASASARNSHEHWNGEYGDVASNAVD
jgi:hypothetical protein